MKLELTIKLEDYKQCAGCPCLINRNDIPYSSIYPVFRKKNYDFIKLGCRKGYVPQHIIRDKLHPERLNMIIRPERCIKTNER